MNTHRFISTECIINCIYQPDVDFLSPHEGSTIQISIVDLHRTDFFNIQNAKLSTCQHTPTPTLIIKGNLIDFKSSSPNLMIEGPTQLAADLQRYIQAISIQLPSDLSQAMPTFMSTFLNLSLQKCLNIISRQLRFIKNSSKESL